MAVALLPLAGTAFAGPSAYVANYSSNSVSVIDVATKAVTGTISVGTSPVGVAVSPDGSRVYVTNRTTSDWDGSVSVIDTASNSVVATIAVPGSPYGVAVTPDGSHIYVANHHPRKISVISASTNTIVKNIDVSIKPFMVAVSPDGSHVYASCQDVCNALAAISTATNTVTGYPGIPAGAQAGLDFSQDSSRVYVSSSTSNYVYVLSTASQSILASIPVGDVTGGVVMSPDGNKVYVATAGGNVSAISTATGAVLATTAVGGPSELRGISLTGDGSNLYVANWSTNSVAVVDTAQNAVTSTIAIGQNPYSFGKFIQQQLYTITGFFAPVNNTPTVNTMNSGASVPVKFSLGGDKGLDILAAGFPSSRQAACDGAAASNQVEETVSAGSSSLQYDATSGQYIYVWKTEKEWANTCRQFELKLKDGTSKKALFKFAR